MTLFEPEGWKEDLVTDITEFSSNIEWKEVYDSKGKLTRTLELGETGVSKLLATYLQDKGWVLRIEVVFPSIGRQYRADFFFESKNLLIEAKQDLGITDPYTIDQLMGKLGVYKRRYPDFKLAVLIYGDAREGDLELLNESITLDIEPIILGTVWPKGQKRH